MVFEIGRFLVSDNNCILLFDWKGVAGFLGLRRRGSSFHSVTSTRNSVRNLFLFLLNIKMEQLKDIHAMRL